MNHSEEEKNFVITIDGPAGAEKAQLPGLLQRN